MSGVVVRAPKAQMEVDEIADYLEQKKPGLGFRFLDAVEQTLRLVAGQPGLGVAFSTANPRLQALRCATPSGFPNHLIFYRPIEGGIEVMRVIHGARNVEWLLENT